jgi:hypothetical protein
MVGKTSHQLHRLHRTNNWKLSAKLFMDHQTENSHHSRTSVVQLNSSLGKLGRLIEFIPSKVKGAVTEITNKCVLAGNILHDEKLKEANEEKDLEPAIGGDGVGAEESIKSIGIRVEGISGGVNITGDVHSSTGDDVTQEGKLADTSVLDLDVTKAIEAGLAGIVEQAEGVEETKRRLGTKLTLEGVEGGGGLAGLGRGKCGGGGGKSGEGGKLHHGGVCEIVTSDRKLWLDRECGGRRRGWRRRKSATVNTSSFSGSLGKIVGELFYILPRRIHRPPLPAAHSTRELQGSFFKFFFYWESLTIETTPAALILSHHTTCELQP